MRNYRFKFLYLLNLMSLLSKRISRFQPSVTVQISQKARDLRSKGKDIISLSSGEPDFNTPDEIKTEAIKAIRNNFTKIPFLSYQYIIPYGIKYIVFVFLNLLNSYNIKLAPYSTVCRRIFLGLKNPRKSTFLFYCYGLDLNDEIS